MSKKVAFEMKVKFNNVEMFDDISAEHFPYAIVVGPEGDDTDSCICVDVSDGEVAEADKNDSTIITFTGESNKNDFVAHALFDALNDIERVGAKFTSNSDYEMDEIIEEIISLKLEGYEDGILTKTFIADEDMLDEFELFE